MRKPVIPVKKISSPFLRAPALYLIFLISCLLIVSCASYQLGKKLDPVSKEFFSKVRYIITKQERKIFLNLPPSEREAFSEDFWTKRDPSPDTEENEFKEKYFSRIEMANRLFRGSATPGWLQDRGRIYILIGPPHERSTYPRGRSLYGKPEEIWYYGFFPLVFIDYDWDGDYDLTPLSARHIAEINRAQMELKPKIMKEKAVFDFNLIIKKIKEDQVLIQIEVPYKNIWFTEEGDKLKTTLGLFMEILDYSEKKVWEHQKNYLVSFTEENLEEIIRKNYLIEIPVALEHGDYILTAELENKTDESRVRKEANFTIGENLIEFIRPFFDFNLKHRT